MGRKHDANLQRFITKFNAIRRQRADWICLYGLAHAVEFPHGEHRMHRVLVHPSPLLQLY